MNSDKTIVLWETFRRVSSLGEEVAFPTQGALLSYIIDQAKQWQDRVSVVFDLDCTLLDNAPREARIMREFGELRGILLLAHCQPEHIQSWSFVKSMMACGMPEVQAKVLEPDLRMFWRERFFTNEYCLEDVPYPGAVPFVQAIHQSGAHVLYCTGRPTQEMGDGTLTSLSECGFPVPNGNTVCLLTKPVFDMSDDEWKAQVIAEVRKHPLVLAAFDNEPEHIIGYAEAFPGAIAVFVDTFHSGRRAPDPSLPSIKHFVVKETR